MPAFSYSINKSLKMWNGMNKRKRNKTAFIAIIVVCINLITAPATEVFANNGKTATEEVEEIRDNSLYAKSAVLMDAESGRVLYGKNEAEQMAMASTTKIMTLLIALEQGDLEQIITVSDYAQSMPDVQLNMKAGEQYVLKDLLYSLMLESHNDSAVAIAEGIAGSIEQFAGRMNKKAKEIGCMNTCFITPNGLDATATMTDTDGNEKAVFHSTTAEDLAKIMSYCITKSPCKEQFLEITQTPTYTFSNCEGTRSFTCQNHNSFLYMMEGAISGKTGFTGKAGYCYVGALEKDNRTFVVALLACGWPNNKSYKWKDTRALMEYGLDNYRYEDFQTAMDEAEKSGVVPVTGGQTKKIGETAFVNWEVKEEDSDVTEGMLLRKDEELSVVCNMEKELSAPVKEGTKIGEITCLVGKETVRKRDIVITDSVKKIDYEWCVWQVFQKFYVF
jgi:D-alanyl-D-alanine carboxypeptidase (penicillin-binding protein 5/6)